MDTATKTSHVSNSEDSLWCGAIRREIKQEEPPADNRLRSRMMRRSLTSSLAKSQPQDYSRVSMNEENETCTMLKSRSYRGIRKSFTARFKSRPRENTVKSFNDIDNHVTKNQEYENEQQEIVFIKGMKNFKIREELHREIEDWRECYENAQSAARIKAKKSYNKKLVELGIENDCLKVELQRIKLQARTIQNNKLKIKWRNYEKQVTEVEQSNEELKTIVENQREELDRYKKILASNESQKSMDDVMNIVSEKEKAKVKRKDLMAKISKIESLAKHKRTQASSARKKLASKMRSLEGDQDILQKGEEIELTDEKYQEHLARAQDLLINQEARDKVLREVDELKFKVECAKAELDKMKSPPPPVQEPVRWFSLFT